MHRIPPLCPLGRRRVSSDEFEPLTSRQDTMGPGAGLCGRGKRCVRAHCLKVVLVLWGVALLLCLLGINRRAEEQIAGEL